MDPNATLAEIREIVIDRINVYNDGVDFDRLLDLVDSLDAWLTSGGFLPQAWNHGGSDGSHQAR